MEVTTVAAQGEAEADFNLVGFNVSLSEVAVASVPVAKAKLKNRIAELDTALSELLERLGLKFVKNSLRSTSHVSEKVEWQNNKQVFLGHEATYNLSFDIDNMSRVNEVYDALTSLDRVKVGQPVYKLKTREKLNKKALKDAFEKVQARFDMECSVLGLDPSDFEIGTWEVRYSDSFRSPKVQVAAARSMTAGAGRPGSGPPGAPVALASAESVLGGSDGAINFVAGLAHVTVNLEVGYQPRTTTQSTQTINRVATVVKEPTSSAAPKENSHV